MPLPDQPAGSSALISWVVANLPWLLPALVAAVGTAWAYAKFIVERSVLPPSEFDVEVRELDVEGKGLVLEILANLKNLGSSPLVVQNLWVDVLYLLQGDPVELWENPSEEKDRKRCGRVHFRRKLSERLDAAAVKAAREEALGLWRKTNKSRRREPRGLPVAPYKTFVSAGVTQRYSFVTALPANTSLVLVHAAFYYEPGGSILQRLVWRFLKFFGLVSHSLQHVREPHTCERVFKPGGAGDPARPRAAE